MKIIISPAKKLNEDPYDINNSTSISFHNESQTIVNELKDYSTAKLISLMNVSTNIANLNNQRFPPDEGGRSGCAPSLFSCFLFSVV